MLASALAPLSLSLLVVAAVFAPSASATTHYLTLINDDAVPAVRIEAAPQGTKDFQVLDTAGALQGGRAGQATVALRDGACVFDLRVTYTDHGPLLITGWNVCRYPRLYLGKARRAGIRRANAAIVPSSAPTLLPTVPNAGSLHD